jgi:hypothetical protein
MVPHAQGQDPLVNPQSGSIEDKVLVRKQQSKKSLEEVELELLPTEKLNPKTWRDCLIPSFALQMGMIQGGEVICPESDSSFAVDPRLEPRFLVSKTSALSTKPQFLSTFS